MEIKGTIGPDGKMKTEINFQGATLPNGRNIDEILNENESLKENVTDLKKQVEETSSILIYFFPNRKIRSIIEVALILGTIWGIVVLIYQK